MQFTMVTAQTLLELEARVMGDFSRDYVEISQAREKRWFNIEIAYTCLCFQDTWNYDEPLEIKEYSNALSAVWSSTSTKEPSVLSKADLRFAITTYRGVVTTSATRQ